MSDLQQTELDSRFIDGTIIAEAAIHCVLWACLRDQRDILNPLIDAASKAVHEALIAEIGEPRLLACQSQAAALFRKGTN